MDRPGLKRVPEGSGEHGKMEGTGCEIVWCPNDTLGYGIGDNNDSELSLLWSCTATVCLKALVKSH